MFQIPVGFFRHPLGKAVGMVFHVAARHLRSRTRQTVLSILSILVGVTALLTAMSLANGLSGEFQKRIMAFSSHLTLTPLNHGFFMDYQKITNDAGTFPEVKESAVQIAGQALIEHKGMVGGIRLYGVETILPVRVPGSGVLMREGNFEPKRRHTVVLGQALAEAMSIAPGASVTISSLDQKGTFLVTGIFESGMYDYDLSFAYTGLATAQWLYDVPDVVTEIGINLQRAADTERIAKVFSQRFNCLCETYIGRNRTFFTALKTEKIVVSLLVLFILIVAGIGIAGNLMLIVSEKKRDIGILRAMGWSKRQVRNLFLLEGALIGLIGTILGTLAGFVLCRYLDMYPVSVPGEVYLLSTLPVTMDAADFFAVNLFAIFCALAASYMPARQASLVHPAEALHME